jgi:hypothetical protein
MTFPICLEPCGGRCTFGVVTVFEYRLHQIISMLSGGRAAHAFDANRAGSRCFCDSTQSLPDEHTIFGGLIHAPVGSGTNGAVMVTRHCGPAADGEPAM